VNHVLEDNLVRTRQAGVVGKAADRVVGRDVGATMLEDVRGGIGIGDAFQDGVDDRDEKQRRLGRTLCRTVAGDDGVGILAKRSPKIDLPFRKSVGDKIAVFLGEFEPFETEEDAFAGGGVERFADI